MNSKIIIIGAGASGIAAATKLLENGFNNLVILEAENRIGGRIDTVPFGENVVDIGAQWCHGEENNEVFELAKRYNLLESTNSVKAISSYVWSNGNVVDKNEARKLLNIAGLLVAKDPKVANLADLIIEEYQKASVADDNSKKLDRESAKEFISFFQKHACLYETAGNWYDVMSKSNLYSTTCEGDRQLNWKNNGYNTILEILMKKYPDPSQALAIDEKILFNKNVEQINWNHEKNNLVEVKCGDGSVYEGDHVIITVSLGVLKERHLQWFKPELPETKLKVITGLSFGVVGKIYLEFFEPFWPKEWSGFRLLWKEEDLIEIQNSDKDWLGGVLEFSTVNYQPNVLCCWFYGDVARKMEAQSDENIINGMIFTLRKFLRGWNVPIPIKMKNSRYFSNRNFCGSYSYKSNEVNPLEVNRDMLATPLINSKGMPEVLFAGEASNSNSYSTVHGAIGSGWREAQRIIDLYKI